MTTKKNNDYAKENFKKIIIYHIFFKKNINNINNKIYCILHSIYI